MLVDLRGIVNEAAESEYALPAFNVFGYEDAIAVVRAAEELGAPVILGVNVPAIKHMPLVYLAPILLSVAEHASIPVCVHLDHGQNLEGVKSAIAHGFSSVMFDGSQLPLTDNIERTKEIVDYAKRHNVSVEAEIGSVGYSDPSMKMKHELSDPDEVALFVRETGIDAVAVSVGTVHRMESQTATIQFDLLERIQAKVDIPLVIHGSTGLINEDLHRLSSYRVGKVNIGTALRMAFGHSMRAQMQQKPEAYDRIQLFQQAMEEVKLTSIDKFKQLGWRG